MENRDNTIYCDLMEIFPLKDMLVILRGNDYGPECFGGSKDGEKRRMLREEIIGRLKRKRNSALGSQ